MPINIREVKIDGASARILTELYEDGPLATTALKVKPYKTRYRVGEHLDPAGWVEQVGKREMQGATRDETIYALTDEGARVVEEHAGELSRPTSFEEVADRLVGVKRDVESTKDSVQSYRQKVRRSNKRSKEARATADEAIEIAEELDVDAPSELAIRMMINEIIDEKLD